MAIRLCKLSCAFVAVSLACVTAPLALLLDSLGLDVGGVQFNGWYVPWPGTLVVALFGVVILTASLHAVRALGTVHGSLARALLLSRDGE